MSWIAECGLPIADCGMPNEDCGMWIAECGFVADVEPDFVDKNRLAEPSKVELGNSAFRNPRSAIRRLSESKS